MLLNTFLNKQWHLYVVVITIVVLSLLPQESFPKQPFSFFDLIVHIIMYGGLAFSVTLAFYEKIKINHTNFINSLFIRIVLLGILLELLQKYLPVNRYFSFEDIAANTIGCGMLFLLAYFIRK